MIKWTDLTLPPINLHNIGSLMLNTRAIEAERELDLLYEDYDGITEILENLEGDYEDLLVDNDELFLENLKLRTDYAEAMKKLSEMEALYEQTKHELKLAKESIHVLLEDK